MKLFYLFFTIIFCFTLTLSAFSGSVKGDSLKILLKKEKNPEEKIHLMIKISWQYLQDDTLQSQKYLKEVIQLADEIKFPRGKADAYTHYGIIAQEASRYGESMKYYLKALKIYDKLNDDKSRLSCLNNLGILYKKLKQYDKALKYIKEVYLLDVKYKDTMGLGFDFQTIGNIYKDMGELDSALSNHKKSLYFFKAYGDSYWYAGIYHDMAIVYRELEKYDEALKYYAESEKIDLEYGNKRGLSDTYNNMAKLFSVTGQFQKCVEYSMKSLELSNQVNNKDAIKLSYRGLAEGYKGLGRYKEALESYEKYSALRDSIFNSTMTEQLAEMEKKYDSERKQHKIDILQKENSLQEEEDARNKAEIRQQNTQKIAFGIGFGLMILVSLLIFRGLRQKQKANEIISRQKSEVESQKILVEHQKELVEEKNKEILDSITYAKRLQDAILPPLKVVKEYLPDSFILYKPKDIVAGDFYFMEPIGTKIVIAAADCTGHGVPGAMVSVVCSNALNRAVKEFKIMDAGEILNKVRDLVLETFSKSESEVKDGMDISLCVLETKTNLLYWSGANNPLWIVPTNDAAVLEIKPDKQPIGKSYEPHPFTTHKIELKKGDTFYIFTDGYEDQFGGEKGKKFKSAKMKEMILQIQNESMENQKNIINARFEEWRGELEQVDDVCVIGVKI